MSFLNDLPGRPCDIDVVAPSRRFCDVTAAAAVDFRPVAAQEGWMTLLNGFLLSVLSLCAPPTASVVRIRPCYYSNSLQDYITFVSETEALQIVQSNVAYDRNSSFFNRLESSSTELEKLVRARAVGGRSAAYGRRRHLGRNDTVS